jgi:hypothetical protein
MEVESIFRYLATSNVMNEFDSFAIAEESVMEKLVFKVKYFSRLVRQAILDEEGRIASFLHAGDFERLQSTALAKIITTGPIKDREILKKKLVEELKDLFPDNPESVDWLMASPACAQRIQYLQDYNLNPRTVALKLEFFLHDKDHATERRARLASALEAKGLTLRADSRYCQQFISGGIDADIENVVGVMRITSWLFTAKGHVAWSNYAKSLEATFRRAFYLDGLSEDEAFRKAKRSFPVGRPKRRRRRYHDDFDDFYDNFYDHDDYYEDEYIYLL